jgi:glyoxylase-like metal-dependent hydrolase (beta-lactamase superfamily II)/rhodanese-related sulfurtransferase
VYFRQLVDDDLGCASYLVGDEQVGEAVVVDPPLAVDGLVAECARRSLRLTRTLETHTHADHVSGHGRLALEHGVPVSIHAAAEPEYPADLLDDGDRVELGDVVLTVLHTPGHRPEHCCLLTGDSLLVGDAARPDLAVEAREGAAGLYGSLRRLLELPDGVEVYPGHVAGSLCGANMSSKASTTIGFERRFNDMLTLGTLDDFVAASMGSAGLRPPNVERIVALNRGPFVAAPAPLAPLAEAGGETVLDVRDAHAFAAGHVQGALNVPLSSNGFATRCGFVLDADERIAVHADSPADAELAARRLNAVGILDLAGRLDDPPTPARLAPVELGELERLLAEDAVLVLDVREADERDHGYIPGSRNVPYRLVRALGAAVNGERPVVTICETGARAGIAASILAAAGVDARPVLDGGVGTWVQRGHATIEFRRCG